MTTTQGDGEFFQDGEFLYKIAPPEANHLFVVLGCTECPNMSQDKMWGLYATGSEPAAGRLFWAIKDSCVDATSNLMYQTADLGSTGLACPRSLYLRLGPAPPLDLIDAIVSRISLVRTHRDWLVAAVNALQAHGLVDEPISHAELGGMLAVASEEAWQQTLAARSASRKRQRQGN